jgi:hypothetical protein
VDEGGVGGEMAVPLRDPGQIDEVDSDHGRGGAVALGETDDALQLASEAAPGRQRGDAVAVGAPFELADPLLRLGQSGAEQRVLVGGLDRKAGEI